jgi:hypothetical protein
MSTTTLVLMEYGEEVWVSGLCEVHARQITAKPDDLTVSRVLGQPDQVWLEP